jgi:hypothetical protein
MVKNSAFMYINAVKLLLGLYKVPIILNALDVLELV